MNLARVLMHAVVVRRELLSSRHPSNIPPFCKIGGQNRKIQCALINQGFSQKATSKTLKILTFLCLFSSPERRSIRRCTEFHLKLKIRWWRHRTGSTPVTGTNTPFFRTGYFSLRNKLSAAGLRRDVFCP